jgi:hypothetical protein
MVEPKYKELRSEAETAEFWLGRSDEDSYKSSLKVINLFNDF